MKTASFVLPILGAALISSATYAGGVAKQAPAKAAAPKQASVALQPHQKMPQAEAKQTASKPATTTNRNASTPKVVGATGTQSAARSASVAKRAHHGKTQSKKIAG